MVATVVSTTTTFAPVSADKVGEAASQTAREIDREMLIALIVECGQILDEQKVKKHGRYVIVHPRWLKMIRAILKWKPLAKRRGPRGRWLALKQRRKVRL